MTAKLFDIDKGYKDFIGELQNLKGKTVKAGVLGSKATNIHKDSDGLTNAEVAAYNEFGTENIPERSFIRSAYDSIADTLIQEVIVLIKRQAKPEYIHNHIGLRLQDAIQDKIREGGEPYTPNAKSTIKAKGFDRPLIDSSEILQVVTYVVEEAKNYEIKT